MIGSSLAPKQPILAPFCGMDHQKSNFSLISDIFSVGGCWGQPMLLFWKISHLKIPVPSSNQIQLAYLYPSEPIHKCHFNMRYPVQCFKVLIYSSLLFFLEEALVLQLVFLLESGSNLRVTYILSILCYITFFGTENEWQKTKPVPISLPRASRNFPDVKTRNFFLKCQNLYFL